MLRNRCPGPPERVPGSSGISAQVPSEPLPGSRRNRCPSHAGIRIRGVITTLEAPPGRRPAQQLVDTSKWYRSLPPEGQAQVASIIRDAVHAAVFGFFCVLDGVRAIDTNPSECALELDHVSGSGRVRLNPEEGEMLHDVYQSLVYEEVFGEDGGSSPTSA